MKPRGNKSNQGSRYGKSAITIFVKPEQKRKIISALAANGYGTTFQEGITKLLESLISVTEIKSNPN